MEAASLISIPESPVPDRGAAEWFDGAGGARLRAAIFQPEGTARGSVVINTGRTESIEKYFEVIGALLGRGFAVLIHDWRGQGLSHRLLDDRLKGHAEGFDDFVADFRTLVDRFEARLPKPWILLGHSMGGCLSMLALMAGEARFSACLLTSPMFGLITKQPTWLVRPYAWLKARFGYAQDFVPEENRDPYWTRFDINVFTHDQQRYKRYSAVLAACPKLALGPATFGWLKSAFDAIDRLQDAASVSIPVVIFSALEDSIVDNAAHKAVAERLPNMRLVDVPGAHHEILIETDAARARFWGVFDEVADKAAPRS